MEIYLDNEIYSPPEPLHETIQDLVAHLRPQLSNDNRMIVSICCDRQAVLDKDLDRVLQQRPGEYSSIDFSTASIGELANSALKAAQQLLKETRPQQAEVIDLLSGDKTDQAIDALTGCIQAWAQANDGVVKTIQLLGLHIDELTYEDTRIVDILNQVAHQLTQLKECLTLRDYVLLNDLLQYEITPTFDQWEGMVTTLLNEIQSRQTAR